MQTDIHPYCDQLTALKTGYPLTSATWPYRGLRNRLLEVEYFLRLSSDKFLVFKWSQVQVQFFKCTGNKLCLRAALIKFRFQSYPRMWKFSQFLQVGKTVDTRVGHAIRPPFMHWLVNIWQVSSCWKFMQQLETFFTHNWSWQGFVSSCDVFTCLFPLDVHCKIQLLSRFFCLFMSGLFIGFLVEEYAACQSHWKSDF